MRSKINQKNRTRVLELNSKLISMLASEPKAGSD